MAAIVYEEVNGHGSKYSMIMAHYFILWGGLAQQMKNIYPSTYSVTYVTSIWFMRCDIIYIDNDVFLSARAR